jgi:hypothetical protein
MLNALTQASTTPRPTPAPPGVVVVGAPAAPQAPAAPLSGDQIGALRTRRTELARQLEAADARREQLAGAIPESFGANRAGLEERITQLDKRILQLESDLAQTDRQLAGVGNFPAVAVMPPSIPEGPSAGQITGISIVFILFVLAPLALALARRLWKRSAAPPPPDQGNVMRRLEQLQQSVDAIAIEVERMSEGQRFVTRLMTESPAAGSAPALGPGQQPAEPIRVPDQDAVRVPRGRG